MSVPAERRTDADARRAGDANLREHAGLLRLVANSVPAMMAFYESDTLRCLFANASYARTFGFTEQTILGRTLADGPPAGPVGARGDAGTRPAG